MRLYVLECSASCIVYTMYTQTCFVVIILSFSNRVISASVPLIIIIIVVVVIIYLQKVRTIRR